MNFYTHKHYEHILSTALEKNWKFKYFKFSEFNKKNLKTCFLRHDCDHNLIAAKRLSEIENKFGVKSTYFLRLDAPLYNLFCSEQENLVNQIIPGTPYTYVNTPGGQMAVSPPSVSTFNPLSGGVNTYAGPTGLASLLSGDGSGSITASQPIYYSSSLLGSSSVPSNPLVLESSSFEVEASILLFTFTFSSTVKISTSLFRKI